MIEAQAHRLTTSIVELLVSSGWKVSIVEYQHLTRLLNHVPDTLPRRRIANLVCAAIAKNYEDQKKLIALFNGYLLSNEDPFASWLPPSQVDKTKLEDVITEPLNEEEIDDDSNSCMPDDQVEENEEETFTITEETQSQNRKQVAIRKKRGAPASNIWRIKVNHPPATLFSTNFNNTFGLLNHRKYTEELSFDVSETIKNAAAKGGYVEFKYRPESRRASYLMLIQRNTHQNHESHFFDHLFSSLRDNDITISRFFFHEDPRICWNEDYKLGVRLVDLTEAYQDATLIIVGQVGRLIDRKGNLRLWTQLFYHWANRILIPYAAPSTWRGQEKVLSRLFLLLPPTEEQIRSIAKLIVDGSTGIQYWNADHTQRHEQAIEYRESLLHTLKYYYEEEMITWISVCAIYPGLYWDLTLHLGYVLEPSGELIQADKILQLFRLPWFLDGEIPPSVRTELLNYLDQKYPQKYKLGVKAIIKIMEDNPPDDSNLNLDDYTLQLTLYQLLLQPRDRQLLNQYQQLNSKADIRRDSIILEQFFNKSDNARYLMLRSMQQEKLIMSENGDIKVGSVIRGVVNNVVDFGAFVTIAPGLFGLVHKSEISETEIGHPLEKVNIHEEIEVKIIRYDQSTKRISLSIKQALKAETKKEAWEKLSVGQIVKGRVSNVKDYGVFVDLGNIVGLLHRSEMSWLKDFEISDLFELGETYDFKIISKEEKNYRIQLGYRDLIANPWDQLSLSIVDDIVEARVMNIVDFGVYLSLDNGLHGLLHHSVIFEFPEENILKKIFKINDKWLVRVGQVNIEEKKIAFALKKSFAINVKNNKDFSKAVSTEIVGSSETGFWLSDLRDGHLLYLDREEIAWMPYMRLKRQSHFTLGSMQQVVGSGISESGIIQASVRQQYPDPWLEVIEKLNVNDVVTGKIIQKLQNVIVVEVLPGVHGKLQNSDVSIGPDPEEDIIEGLTIGNDYEMKIIRLLDETRHIGLSIRHLAYDPWNSFIEQKNIVGRIINVLVTSINEEYAIAKIDEEIFGIIYKDEIDWGPINLLGNYLDRNKVVQVVVIGILERRRLLKLSIKRLVEGPKLNLEFLSKEKPLVSGIVIKIDDGYVLQLENGIKAYLPYEEVGWGISKEESRGVLSIGDSVEAKFISANIENAYYVVSIKQVSAGNWESNSSGGSLGGLAKGDILKGEVIRRTDKGRYLIRFDDNYYGQLRIQDVVAKQGSLNNPNLNILYQGQKSTFTVKKIDLMGKAVLLSWNLDLNHRKNRITLQRYFTGTLLNREKEFVELQLGGDLNGMVSKNDFHQVLNNHEFDVDDLQDVGDLIFAPIGTDPESKLVYLTLPVKNYDLLKAGDICDFTFVEFGPSNVVTLKLTDGRVGYCSLKNLIHSRMRLPQVGDYSQGLVIKVDKKGEVFVSVKGLLVRKFDRYFKFLKNS